MSSPGLQPPDSQAMGLPLRLELEMDRAAAICFPISSGHSKMHLQSLGSGQ